MMETLTFIILIIISISIALCMIRVYKGPTTPDRVIALDTVAVNVLAFIAVLSMHLNTEMFFDAVLVIAVIAFVGTVAIAKYLMKGDIIK
jgi:multisubunit Na+/H+ antiporter MnhF subunit